MGNPNPKVNLHQPADPFRERVEKELTSVPKKPSEILDSIRAPGISRGDVIVALEELKEAGKAIRFWKSNHEQYWREA